MGYQPGAARSGRPRGFDKPKKVKTRKATTHHTAGARRGESEAQTIREIVDKALAGLNNLGAQTFATPPFHQHFDRWRRSLEIVLDDFEATPAVKVDDRFHEERGGLLSAVEAALKAEQAKEAGREAKILGIHGSKDLLLQAEREHEARLRELSVRRDEKLKSLGKAVETLRVEFKAVQNEKPGLFERFTNKKAQTEGEFKSRIAASESVLNTARTSFDEEAAHLHGEYAERKSIIMEKVTEERAMIEGLEAEAQVDNSVEVRRVACEELAEAIRGVVERQTEPKCD